LLGVWRCFGLTGVVLAIDIGAYLVFAAWWLEFEWVIGKRICRLKASNWLGIIAMLALLTSLSCLVFPPL